jgi:DNA-binding MarR family transcriptional regulator
MTEQVGFLMTRQRRLTAIRLANAMVLLQRLDKNIRMRGVYIFLLVGHQEGLTVGEIAQRCGVRKNIVSRYLSDLGTVDRHGKPGLGLITMVLRVYGDRRQRHVHLTERGQQLVQQMGAAVIEPRPRSRF